MLIILSGCSVTVPAVPLCAELSPTSGYCINTLTSEEFRVDEEHPYQGQTWWQMRPTMVHLPAQSWAKLKTFIIQVCAKTKKCNENLGSWDRTVKGIDEMVGVKP